MARLWRPSRPKKKKVRRWFYIDIRKALDQTVDREEAIVGVPEDKMERTDFGREITRDLSTPEKEYAALMYPVSQVFDWDKWQDGFDEYWCGDQHKSVRDEFRAFKRRFSKTSNITASRSSPWTDRLPRRPCASCSRR